MIIHCLLTLVLAFGEKPFNIRPPLFLAGLLKLKRPVVLRTFLVNIGPWVFSITFVLLNPLLLEFLVAMAVVVPVSVVPTHHFLFVGFEEIFYFGIPFALDFEQSSFYFDLHFLLNGIDVCFQLEYSLLHPVGPAVVLVGLVALVFEDRTHFLLNFLHSSHHILLPPFLLLQFADLMFLQVALLPIREIRPFLRLPGVIIIGFSSHGAF